MINHEILIAKGFESFEDEEDNAIYTKGNPETNSYTHIVAYLEENFEHYYLDHNGNIFEITSIDPF